ncbi:MAG TPA: helix-turn-helix transcriptional regulator [Bryobacteraceae bacterium]|nr:helix-turn-helix transcriptional regulator [Bryobacteraceae bacterium]
MQEKIRVALGERIRELRRAAGYSQESFADHVGIHRTYGGELERGEANVTLENLLKIAKGLDTSLSELFAGIEERARSVTRTPKTRAQRNSAKQ